MSEKSSINDYIWPNKHLMNFMGFWPREPDLTDKSRFYASFRIVLSTFSLFTLFIPQLLAVVHYWGDLFKLTDIISTTIAVGQVAFKMFYVLARHRQFCKIYHQVHKVWLMADDRYERESLEDMARLANRITIVLFLMCCLNVITFASASIVIWRKNYLQANVTSNDVNYLPVEVWYGVDTQHSPNFEMAILLQIVGMTFAATGISGFDATMVTLILHVSGQFRLISVRLRSIDHRFLHLSKSESRLEIRRCIEHHKLILRMALDMRRLLSPMIFVQLMSSGLEICMCGCMLVLKDSTNILVFKYSLYSVTMFFQLFLWCWPGELLIHDSTAIGDVIYYDIFWYQLPTDLQRDLGVILMRAQKQCCVTALGFQIMSMRKLTEVFNTAISYFALLRSVNAK